jgi:cyanophycinase
MEKPRGILIPIGGGEDKEGKMSIISRVIDETKRRNPLFEIITTATNHPREIADGYIDAFETLGVNDAGEIYIEERRQAAEDDILRRIERCDGVFFCGGNQLKLSTLLGGTEFLKILHERYMEDDNFVVAGTSAGAAAMSATMIVAGSSQDALIKGQLQLSSGLDFISKLFIDTHVTERGRLGRLIQTVTANPEVLALGLGEDTGAVIYEGKELEIIGSGLAVIADGLSITYTDLTDIWEGEPISVEGITIHVLGKEKRFLLDERKVLK